MMQFLLFWWTCLVDAYKAGRGVLSLITVAGFVLWLWHGRKHEHQDEALKTNKRFITTCIYWLCLILAPLYALLVAPYYRYSEINSKAQELTKQSEDTAPKLTGFIDQTIFAQQANTNILIFQVSIANAGRLPSMAEDFRLRVLTAHATNKADLIDISDTYTRTVLTPNAPNKALVLKRSELIAEKTVKAIQPGDVQRGWIAFTLTNIAFPQLTNSTIVLSFTDILGRHINVTNGYWRGEHVVSRDLDLPMHLPGSDSIMSQAQELTNSRTWMPLELPADCMNVTVYFGGAEAISCPLTVAKMSPEANGTPFLINELPDFLLKDIDKTPNYSPRINKVWFRSEAYMQYGQTMVNLPFLPHVVSNRLYLYVQVPFQPGKHRLIMSEDFDTILSSLPNSWDRNFHTNYLMYEIVNDQKNPVLQVAYPAPNEIVVNGVFVVSTNQFLDAFWQPPQLITLTPTLISLTNVEPRNIQPSAFALGTNTVGELITNAMYNWSFAARKRWFKYPSNRNRSVLADDVHVSPAH